MQRLLSKPIRLNRLQLIVTKFAIHLIASGYLAILFYLATVDRLGADPVEALLNSTGISAINLLLFTLVLSPFAKHLPCGDLIKLRRMAGIYVFVYALSHFLTYAIFELQLNIDLIASEVAERPYIMVGFAALLILLSLTVTSPNIVRKKMGRRWQTLHKGVYVATFLALLHFTWALKTGWQSPVFYWIAAAAILLLRKNKLVPSR